MQKEKDNFEMTNLFENISTAELAKHRYKRKNTSTRDKALFIK